MRFIHGKCVTFRDEYYRKSASYTPKNMLHFEWRLIHQKIWYIVHLIYKIYVYILNFKKK